MSKDKKKQLIDMFNNHSYTLGVREAFNVFIAYSASRLNLAYLTNGDEARVKMLNNMIKSSDYTKEELSTMFNLMVDSLEENLEQDLLGEIFTELNLTNAKSGQFFTSYTISKFMAEMNLNEISTQRDTPITIADPCCGTGGMLIAAGNVIKDKKLKPEKFIFYAQDIDWTVAMAAFIQLSLHGLPGMVVIGNSLDPSTSPPSLQDKDNCWITSPTYIYHPQLFEQLDKQVRQVKKQRNKDDRLR